MREPYHVQSVSRSFRILETLSEDGHSLSLAEIAQRTNLPKSTVHRLLETLRAEGYVQQDEVTRRFRLGAKLLQLASVFLSELELREIARPCLQALSQSTRETIHLGVLDEGEVLYIDKIESPQIIRLYSRVGRRAPLHCTGLGKAILAHLPPETQQKILETKGLRRYTDNTITDPEQLRQELARVRREGIAFDFEEHEPNVRCVAAPILHEDGEVAGAVSVTGPAYRMSTERMQQLVPQVASAAEEISRRLRFALMLTGEQGGT